MPGVYTGTVYHDLELVQQGMLGEGHTGTDVLTVKDHCVRHMRGNRSHCGQGYDKVRGPSCAAPHATSNHAQKTKPMLLDSATNRR